MIALIDWIEKLDCFDWLDWKIRLYWLIELTDLIILNDWIDKFDCFDWLDWQIWLTYLSNHKFGISFDHFSGDGEVLEVVNTIKQIGIIVRNLFFAIFNFSCQHANNFHICFPDHTPEIPDRVGQWSLWVEVIEVKKNGLNKRNNKTQFRKKNANKKMI